MEIFDDISNVAMATCATTPVKTSKRDAMVMVPWVLATKLTTMATDRASARDELEVRTGLNFYQNTQPVRICVSSFWTESNVEHAHHDLYSL